MDATRLLVKWLLVGCVLTGFASLLPVETGSGVVTSISTITSTSYSYRYWVSYSTELRSVTTTSGTLTQTKMKGEYLEITGQYGAEGNDVWIRFWLRNVMNLQIDRGIIVLSFTSSLSKKTPTLEIPFGLIRPQETIKVENHFYVEIIVDKSYFDHVLVFCESFKVTTLVPAATYTYSGTQTESYVKTYLTTYVMSEAESLPMTSILISLVILGAALVLALAYRSMKRREPSPPPKPYVATTFPSEAPQATSVPPKTVTLSPVASQVVKSKYCLECGLALPIQAKHCPKCGTRQDQQH